MARRILLLVVGALVGALAVLALVAGPSPDLGVPPVTDEFVGSLPDPVPAAETTVHGNSPWSASFQLALHEDAVVVEDPYELEFRIERLSSEPRSRERDARLRTLLYRLAELDVGRAARFARSANLETRFLVPLYRYWALTDTDSVLDQLADSLPAVEVHLLALAVLDALGNEPAAMSRVAAVLPELHRNGFIADALVARAVDDPEGALEAFTELRLGIAGTMGIGAIGEALAYTDLDLAFSLADRIDDRMLQSAYVAAVLGAWTDSNPEGVFAYLESMRVGSRPAEDAISNALRATGVNATLLQRIAEHDPLRLLNLADDLPSDMRGSAWRAALDTLAAVDPVAALAHLDRLPAGQQRNAALQAIARSYGRQNPDAAVAWAQASSPQSLQAVFNGIATVDLDYALDLLLATVINQDSDASGMGFLLPLLATTMLQSSNDASEMARVVDRLVGVDDPAVSRMVGVAVSRWAQRHPDAATDWMLANSARLSVSDFSSAAQGMARGDPDAASRMLNLLTGEERDFWLRGAASGIAQVSPQQAEAFLDRHRGEPGFDQGLAMVATQWAMRDPEAAARLLDRHGSSPAAVQAAPTVASQWAQHDPAAAVDWAMGIADESVRSRAVATVVGSWAQSSPDAARQWLRQLPGGASRDQAVSAHLAATAQAGSIDTSLLNAFSSDGARQQAISGALIQLGQQDPEQARTLMDTWITDRALRRVTEEGIARNAGTLQRSAFPTFLVLP